MDSNELDLKAQLAALQSTLAECLESGDVAGMGRAKAKIKKMQAQLDALNSGGSETSPAPATAAPAESAPAAAATETVTSAVAEPQAKTAAAGSAVNASAELSVKTASTSDTAQSADVTFTIVTPGHMGVVSGAIQNVAVVSASAGVVTPDSVDNKKNFGNNDNNLTSSVASKLLPSKKSGRNDKPAQEEKEVDVDALFAEERLAALARGPQDEDDGYEGFDGFDDETMPLQFSPNFEPDFDPDANSTELNSEGTQLSEELLKIAVEASIGLEESGPIVNLDSEVVDSANSDSANAVVLSASANSAGDDVELVAAASADALLSDLLHSDVLHGDPLQNDDSDSADEPHLHSIAQLLIESLEHGAPDPNEEIKTSYLSEQQLSDLTERFYTISSLPSDEQSLEIDAVVREIIEESATVTQAEVSAHKAEELRKSVSNLVSELEQASSASSTSDAVKKGKEVEAHAKVPAAKDAEGPSVKKELSKFWKFFTKPEQFLAEESDEKGD